MRLYCKKYNVAQIIQLKQSSTRGKKKQLKQTSTRKGEKKILCCQFSP